MKRDPIQPLWGIEGFIAVVTMSGRWPLWRVRDDGRRRPGPGLYVAVVAVFWFSWAAARWVWLILQ